VLVCKASYNAVANLLYWHQGGGHNSRDLVAILVIRPIAREALLPTGAEGLDDDGEWLLKVLWMAADGFGWCAIPTTLKKKLLFIVFGHWWGRAVCQVASLLVSLRILLTRS